MKKLKDFFKRLNDKVPVLKIKKFLWFVVLCCSIFIISIIFYHSCLTSNNTETAYADNASMYDSNDYSQLYGLIIYAPNRKIPLDYSRDYEMNINIFPDDGDVSLIYFDCPVLIVECGNNVLYFSAPSVCSYRMYYDLTLYDGTQIVGEMWGSGDCNVFGEFELRHDIPFFMFYRINELSFEYTLTGEPRDYYAFHLEYTNGSELGYREFIFFQRDFVEHLDYLNGQTLGSIGNQIADFGTSLLNLEIFPDFRFMDLLMITLGVALAMAIAKLWLGG